jgi:hypothetical protein
MAISSQGTTFTFAGSVYTVTSVAVNYGGSAGGAQQRQRVSAAYLDSDPTKAEPFLEIWQPDPAGDGRLATDGGTSATAVQHSVQIDFIGTSPPAYRATGTLAIAGPVVLSFSAATCESSSVNLAAGDIVRGSATFTVQ